MAGTVIVPWYATGLRANGFAEDLQEVASTALRYGATSYRVYRSQTTNTASSSSRASRATSTGNAIGKARR